MHMWAAVESFFKNSCHVSGIVLKTKPLVVTSPAIAVDNLGILKAHARPVHLVQVKLHSATTAANTIGSFHTKCPSHLGDHLKCTREKNHADLLYWKQWTDIIFQRGKIFWSYGSPLNFAISFSYSSLLIEVPHCHQCETSKMIFLLKAKMYP